MAAAYEPAAGWPRADAHIHLVPPEGVSWAAARQAAGVVYNEPVMYDRLAATHGVEHVLVVSVDTANNGFIAAAAQDYPWCRPAAWFDPRSLTVSGLEALPECFVGIAMYLGEADNEALAAVAPEVWRWLDARRWIVSCNGGPDHWPAWLGVLQAHPTLRLLASHLGSPGPAPESERDEPAAPEVYEARLGALLRLAEFPGPRVKLSGFREPSAAASRRSPDDPAAP